MTQAAMWELERWERGRKSVPSTRRKLATARGISPDDLCLPPFPLRTESL